MNKDRFLFADELVKSCEETLSLEHSDVERICHSLNWGSQHAYIIFENFWYDFACFYFTEMHTVAPVDFIKIGIISTRKKIYYLTARHLTSIFEKRFFLHQILMKLNQVDRLRVYCKVSNEIWWAAGDTSNDFSFYSKRLILHHIYADSIRIYMQSFDKDEALQHAENMIMNISKSSVVRMFANNILEMLRV